MNEDFIFIKGLEGELKLSQVKRGLRYTVTTKEIIFQKPHRSYYISLKDIIQMLPFQIEPTTVTFQSMGEKIKTSFGSSYYKIRAEKGKIYNRSGIHEQRGMEIIIPLSQKFLNTISKYSNLVVIH